MALSMAALSHRPRPPTSLRFDSFRTLADAGARFLQRMEPAVSSENAGSGLCAFGGRLVMLNRGRLVASLAALQDESKHPDIEFEKAKNELEGKDEESQEAWEQTLEVFKEEAAKMQAISQAAYEAYSKKAMIVLKETSERLKIEANKARHDLAIVAKEFGEEGVEYLTNVAEKSPEPVKDVVETFSSSTPKFTHLSEVRDFYLGIPYGLFLAAGGILGVILDGGFGVILGGILGGWFGVILGGILGGGFGGILGGGFGVILGGGFGVILGGILGGGFGVILGGALLALSIQSLRCWKRGESSSPYLKGQTECIVTYFFEDPYLAFRWLQRDHVARSLDRFGDGVPRAEISANQRLFLKLGEIRGGNDADTSSVFIVLNEIQGVDGVRSMVWIDESIIVGTGDGYSMISCSSGQSTPLFSLPKSSNNPYLKSMWRQEEAIYLVDNVGIVVNSLGQPVGGSLLDSIGDIGFYVIVVRDGSLDLDHKKTGARIQSISFAAQGTGRCIIADLQNGNSEVVVVASISKVLCFRKASAEEQIKDLLKKKNFKGSNFFG